MTITLPSSPRVDYGNELDGIFTLDEFIEEFSERYQPGQHVIAFGPTGRGKTTVMGKLLKATNGGFTQGMVATTITPDKALAGLGKPIKNWPPSLHWQTVKQYPNKAKYHFRYEPTPKKTADLAKIRNVNQKIFHFMFGRKDWTLFVPDLQVYCDRRMMNLGADLEQLILTIRKLGSSVWLDAQAPRWIPSAMKDQPTHLFIWRNRNEDVMKDLSRATGINKNSTLTTLTSHLGSPESKRLHYRDFLWVDGLNDEFFLVENPPVD